MVASLEVTSPYPATCPGPVAARILSKSPSGTSGSGERNSSHSRPRRASSNRAVQAGQIAMCEEKVASSSGFSSPSSASARSVSHWPQAGEFGMKGRSAMLHHLPFTTFKQARKFRASPADAGLYGTFGYAQHLGDLFIVQILQIS